MVLREKNREKNREKKREKNREKNQEKNQDKISISSLLHTHCLLATMLRFGVGGPDAYLAHYSALKRPRVSTKCL